MNNRSFSSRLSWRIISIVSIIFFVSFIVIGVVSQYAITHRSDLSITLVMSVNLVIVGVVGLTIMFFLCRREIRRMTRPVTELSVSALNMAKGNFKAKLPEIGSQDEMLRLRDSFVYLQNSISDYIGQLKTTRSDKERMESELNVARTIQMGMLNTDFPPQLHAMLIPAKEVGGDLYDFIRKVLYRQAREVVISSKDLIDIYIDGEQLPGSQFHLKILPGALPLRLPKPVL